MKSEKQKKEGEFYTPKYWVDEAHKYIEKEYGNNWRNEYIVWDCAWGSGNLTRDYKFKELYCSTLHQSDIDKSDSNKESIRFQFDFLNDSDDKLKDKAPNLLTSINLGKPIIFLINPPYATASRGITLKSENRNGLSNTNINKLMKDDKWGASSQQLYAQFLYRITEYQKVNRNIHIAMFVKPLFLTGSSYKKFRLKFFNYFKFNNGFIFKAKHFVDVGNWGIIFSIFKPGVEVNNKFKFDVYEN